MTNPATAPTGPSADPIIPPNMAPPMADGDGRRPVGFLPSWRVSSYVLATRDDTVLMVEPVWAERWELPGGEVETTETLVEGAIRECLEETGHRFSATTTSPFDVGEEFFYLTDVSSYCHSVLFVFRGSAVDARDPTWRPDPTEVRRVGWVELSSLNPSNTHACHWRVLQKADLVR